MLYYTSILPMAELKPFPRPLMEKTVEILLKTTVNDFGLTICLWMVGGAHFKLSSRHYKEFLPKLSYKDGIAITYNRFGHAKELHHAFYKCVSYDLSCKGMGKIQKMSILT